MASILKVDELQGATTATAVAMPSNTHIPGAVVQVIYGKDTSANAFAANTSATGHTTKHDSTRQPKIQAEPCDHN